MNCRRLLSVLVLPVVLFSGCGSEDEAKLSSSRTALNLTEVKTNPSAPGNEWFDFRPNVKKLILAGAAETEHVAILWYTVPDGAVGLHYHSKTESVYVIEGTQTDGKGVYPTGTVYFNPPGSGHQITDSSGFFLLAYAAPPDFANTALIGEYTPVRIDTTAADLTTVNAFEPKAAGIAIYTVPVDGMGSLSAAMIDITTAMADYTYTGNYLLVLGGTCEIDGLSYGREMLVVTKTVVPEAYKVGAPANGACLALGVSF